MQLSTLTIYISNFMDCFLSVASWSDPVRYPQIPVRAVAKGQRLKDDGSTAAFLHYYDYIDFKPVVDDPSVFEVSLSRHMLV